MRSPGTIASKVLTGFAVVLVTFGAVTAFGVWQMRRVGANLALVSQAYHPLTRVAAQLDASFRTAEEATRRVALEKDPRVRESLLDHAIGTHPRQMRDRVHDAQDVLASARALGAGEEEASFLDRIEGLLAGALLRYEGYVVEGTTALGVVRRQQALATEERDALEPELVESLRRLKRIEEQIGLGLRDISTEVESRIDLRLRQTQEDERQAAYLVVVLSMVALIVALVVSALIRRALVPIRRLTEAVKDVGEGRFEREIDARGEDEVGILAREFNAMSRKLAERDRQLAEKTSELLRSERLAAVGKLAAQITHEIRNPLSSLSLNTELLREAIDEGEFDAAARAEARSLIVSMGREMDRLTEITEEYLRFARLPKPVLAAVDVNDAVTELSEFVAAELRAAGITLDRHPSPEEPIVLADASQLRQVLLNLVRNAREAMPKGGRISLSTRLDAPHARAVIEVADDGPGIDASVLPRIFEPFFTTKERGTGLGLALCQQVLHEHGGDLVCDSAPGRGTRMRIELPLAPLAELRPSDAVPAAAAA